MERKRVHFSGIGGTAMVAGARLALEAGWEVRGSDQRLYPPASDMVAALGVPVYEGYAGSNLEWGPDLVIIGNALSRGNPEVEACLDRRLHYVSLPEWLKDGVLRERRPLVVTGTHGKTTTTALAAWLLDSTGFGPGYLIGGQPLGFAHSARLGAEGGAFVIEGDEYDTAFFDKRAKFFHYLPEMAVVTSLEFDHGDIYRDVEEIETAFRRMLRLIPREGTLIVCADAPRALALRDHAYCRVMSYGVDSTADWVIRRGDVVDGLQAFSVWREGRAWGEFRSPLFGSHNLLNAAAALAAASVFGAAPGALADALAAFPGIRRRMEVFHEARGVTFVDDFAHHPTAIRETIAAARVRWPGRRLVVLFEPRSNTTVTNRFQAELAEAFAGGDEIWIGPLHRGEEIPESERLDRGALAGALSGAERVAGYMDDVEALAGHVLESARAGDVVLVLSNGAFGGVHGKLKAAFR